jgi:hypothetical protein
MIPIAFTLVLVVLLVSVVALVSAAVGEPQKEPPEWPTDLFVHHACPGAKRAASSLWQRFSGALAASIFTITYIAVPCLLVAIPTLMAIQPYWWVTWALAGPFILSALLPPMPSRSSLQAWPFCHMPKYFNFSEIRETSDDEIQALIKSRPVIFSIQPHGVFSFGGASAGVEWAKRWWHPKLIPTSAASSVIRTPLIKHVVGLFGVVDASAKSLTKWLGAGKSAVLYIGGVCYAAARTSAIAPSDTP